MGDVSEHFSRHEFACKCGCGQDTVDVELITVLENLRIHFTTAKNTECIVSVESGNRCVEYNEKVQRQSDPTYLPYSSKSQHLVSKAADVKIYMRVGDDWQQLPPDEVATYLDRKHPNKYGVGYYNTWTHIDVRKSPGRWDKRT